jgi:hypothetical protein
LRFVDPLRTVLGEFYDESGNMIGDDKTPDNKVYVTDKQTIAANSTEGKTNRSAVQGGQGTVLLPDAETRMAMGDAIQEATPYNEVGGLIALTFDGKEKVLNSKPRAPASPTKDEEVGVDVWNLQNPAELGNVKEVKSPFHAHPSGSEKVGNKINCF